MKRILTIIIICISIFSISSIVFADNITLPEVEIGEILMGDADNNGEVNAVDALKLLKIVAKIESVDNTFSIRKNDFNHDYILNAEDALSILKTSAKIEGIKTIEDPNNFFRDIEYKNGYPLHDYICKDIYSNVYITKEGGLLDNSTWKLDITRITGSIIEESKSNSAVKYSEGLEKYYWNIIWMLQDAIESGEYEITDKNSLNFTDSNDSNFLFDGYGVVLNARALCHVNSKMKIKIFISGENEIYYEISNRNDLVSIVEQNIIYKYTGDIPECLQYEEIKEYFESLNK